MAKTNIPESPSINLLGAGTSIKGDIKSNGDFRIDGSLVGSIHSKGKVIIGTTGKVDGEIICQNADISGEVKAQVTVAELLSLKATSKISGDVTTNKLAIESGAKFSGSCSMDSNEVRKDKFSSPTDKPGPKEKIA